MNLKEFVTEDRAVSPVIGVILMVAITVILAAVIGTFVLGLGDSVQQQSPSASFGFDYGDNASAGVTITHEGGDSIDGDTLNTSIDGTDVASGGDYGYDGDSWADVDSVSAGTSVTVSHNTSGESWSGEEIRVIWTSNDGSSSQTIGSSTAPNN